MRSKSSDAPRFVDRGPPEPGWDMRPEAAAAFRHEFDADAVRSFIEGPRSAEDWLAYAQSVHPGAHGRAQIADRAAQQQFRASRAVDAERHFVGPDGTVYRRDADTPESRGWTRRRQLAELSGAAPADHKSTLERYFPQDPEPAGFDRLPAEPSGSGSVSLADAAEAGRWVLVNCDLDLPQSTPDPSRGQTTCVYKCDDGTMVRESIPGLDPSNCLPSLKVPRFVEQRAPAPPPPARERSWWERIRIPGPPLISPLFRLPGGGSGSGNPPLFPPSRAQATTRYFY